MRPCDAGADGVQGGLATAGSRYDLIRVVAGRAQFPNFMYVVFDRLTRDAVVIDPGWEADLLLGLLRRHRLRLVAVLLSHSHIDHTASAGRLVAATGCLVHGSVAATSHLPDGCRITDAIDGDRDRDLALGSLRVRALATPGHTACSICYLIGDMLFTGDTLFIEGCGLSTAPGGRPQQLFQSIQKLKQSISDEIRVFPGHSYRSGPGAAFGNVKARNIYLQLREEADFVAFCERPRREGAKPPAVGTVPAGKATIDYAFTRDALVA